MIDIRGEVLKSKCDQLLGFSEWGFKSTNVHYLRWIFLNPLKGDN